MAGTEVLTGRLIDVAKNLEDIIGRYNTTVNKVYQIGEEIDAMWDGPPAINSCPSSATTGNASMLLRKCSMHMSRRSAGTQPSMRKLRATLSIS